MSLVTVAQYVERWGESPLDAFVRDNPAFVLVEAGAHSPATGVEAELPHQDDFLTTRLKLADALAPGPEANERAVYPVQKRPGALFRATISVGRTPNLDICIQRTGISKLHAHFTFDEQDHTWLLTDKSSTNGTHISGVRSQPNRPVPVVDGCEIRFAQHVFKFTSPAAFHRMLVALHQQR